ncbi:MAG: hypothetical protein K8R36_06770 [Planctomycetales bacterium]|nr:hypothetical protein [Planctomycetales bacterium]
MWSAVLLFTLAAAPVPEVQGTAQEAFTENFRVTATGNPDARTVAKLCEAWRTHLRVTWCPKPEVFVWTTKCDIVVHATKTSYVAAVGRGAERTAGSSLIDFKDKQVSLRRIDLLAEGGRGLAALPHEMTHVVLADLFGGRQPPRWADEGIAMLGDSKEKQKLHQQDLEAAFGQGLHFRAVDLMTMQGYPQPHRMGAFYGQSASLASYLAHRDQPAKFVTFLKGSMEKGYDQALRDVYAIDGVGELERLWAADRQAAIAFHGMRLTLDEEVLKRINLP